MEADDVTADVKKLREGLQELPEATAHPVLVIISGLPGTGKSHFSRKLAERLPGVVLESDVFRKQLFRYPVYSSWESQRLFAALHRLTEELLISGITVILDATNLIEQHREHLYNIAYRVKVKLIIVQVEAPWEVVSQRLQERSMGAVVDGHSDADLIVYQRMMSQAEKIRRNHFSVDTSKDINPIISKIVREARKKSA